MQDIYLDLVTEEIIVEVYTGSEIPIDVYITETGPKGDSPAYEWDGTSLRFENPDGTWGAYVNLKGETGEQGIQGIQGIQGEQGIQGVQGEKGDTGEVTQLEFDALEDRVVINETAKSNYDKVFADRKLSEKFDLKTFAETISGFGYIDLKDANGQVSCVVEGQSVTNLVANGDFRNGTTGWVSGPGGEISVANNICKLKLLSIGANRRIETTNDNAIVGNVYFIRGYIKPLYNNLVFLGYGNVTTLGVIPVPNVFNKLTAIVTATSNARFRFYVDTVTNYAINDEIEFKECEAINLTAMGLASITDVPTLDRMFPNYIDGTKHTFSFGGVLECKDKLSAVNTRLFLPSGLNLRSVPAIKDTVSITDDSVVKTQNVSVEYALQSADINQLFTGTTNFDIVGVARPVDMIALTSASSGNHKFEGFTPYVGQFGYDAPQYVYYSYSGTYTLGDKLNLFVPKGTFPNLAAAKAFFAGTILNYQLAVPVITDITEDCQGMLQSYPGGSIRAFAAKNGFTITETTDVTGAVSVYKVTRFDIEKGKVIEVDVTSDCSIVGNNLVISGFVLADKKTYHYSCLTDASNSTTPNIVAQIGLDFGIATKNYGGLTTAWTLNDNENKASMLIVTNAGGAVQAIANPYAGKEFIIDNTCGHTVTLKTASTAGVAILNNTVRKAVWTGTAFKLIT